MALFTPSTLDKAAPPPRETPGGDSSIPRDRYDRPLILVMCAYCEGEGCAKDAEGFPGMRRKPYQRVTTFIDVLEDKSGIRSWEQRYLVAGLTRDSELYARARGLDPDVDKKELNQIAGTAKAIAGISAKADKGSHLHLLTEIRDAGVPYPPGTSAQDIRDVDAYLASTEVFSYDHIERLVVHDDFEIAGTPDRVARIRPGYELTLPDGEVLNHEGPGLITDLKTGNMSYGHMKFAMQLRAYAESWLYFPETGERASLDVSRRWGLILSLVPGSGECVPYWVNLEAGAEGLAVAANVRAIRKSKPMHKITAPLFA